MDIDAVIIAAFRVRQPPFASDTEWPDAVVESALCEGDAETGSSRWGGYEDECQNFKQRGMFFYAAHWLGVTYPSGGTGTVNGGASFAVSAKSVADESVTLNNGNLSNASVGDAWLASSGFGQQFLRLRKRASMGAVAV